MENARLTDPRNLILYHPDNGKSRRLCLGFSWLFFLWGVFGFFFRGLFKDGLLGLLALAVMWVLFDNEVGYWPVFDFKHVGFAVAVTLAMQGNFYCLQRWTKQGYRLDRTSPQAAAQALKSGKAFLNHIRYAELKEELEKIAARESA